MKLGNGADGVRTMLAVLGIVKVTEQLATVVSRWVQVPYFVWLSLGVAAAAGFLWLESRGRKT
jgi:hypothetical protein